MAVMNVFKTTTTAESPLDASTGTEAKPPVSDFITVQSFTNFAAMTGAITAAWHALQRLTPEAAAIWVPYLFALAWAIVSLLISKDGLKKTKDGRESMGAGNACRGGLRCFDQLPGSRRRGGRNKHRHGPNSIGSLACNSGRLGGRAILLAASLDPIEYLGKAWRSMRTTTRGTANTLLRARPIRNNIMTVPDYFENHVQVHHFMNIAAQALLSSADAGDDGSRSFPRRLLDFVFGYDFFISYSWSDGAAYASALASRLKADGFQAFWIAPVSLGRRLKKAGAWTLRHAGELILVGSPAAIRSGPVIHEVEIFSKTRRKIVPINFAGSLDWKRSDSGLAPYLPADIIKINEPATALHSGPSEEAVADIRRTFNLVRQDKKRMRVLAIIAPLLGVLTVAALAFATYAFLDAKWRPRTRALH